MANPGGQDRGETGPEAQEFAAVSGALTLLTNIALAWTTAVIPQIDDAIQVRFPPAHLVHIAPVAFHHIVLHRKLHFSVRELGARGSLQC